MYGYVLGLDIGSASLGWALIEIDDKENPISLLKAGVRIFEPGVEGSAVEIEKGKDKSKAEARRTARLQRRQLRRRAARQRDLFRVLQRERLLPAGVDGCEKASSEGRHAILNELDRQLRDANRIGDSGGAVDQVLPYYLRKSALDRKLEPYELGRVLYHLIQRRGFKSNRKEGKEGKDKDELGKVKSGISELAEHMRSAGARTIGEYFAGLDPHECRIRGRWTARTMFEQEFEEVWAKQQEFYPEICTPELKAEIHRLMFFQRPIASQEHLIGMCELERHERKAPWATLEAQRFRVLQKVNDLKSIQPGGLDEKPLTGPEQQVLFAALENEGDLTFARLRKLLGYPRQTEFNLERGGNKCLKGNRVNAHLRSVFGERWSELSATDQGRAVQEWRDTESSEKLVSRGITEWKLDQAKAEQWADVLPEPGYCGLSRKAIRHLLPRMEKGVSFATAKEEVYGSNFSGGETLDHLPPVRKAVPALRNPAVERALTETRKVVNAIVREYGKPYEIRLEMARELRKPRKEREKATDLNRRREKERERAKADLLRECQIQNPSRADIEKALLLYECKSCCPYTGRTISFSSLFSDSQYDVEHILPLSRYPDDSFLNKTLCYHEENRSVKRGRTPWEAYGHEPDQWAQILERVKKFDNPVKLRRFQLRTAEELEGFTARQMNDTRYTTRLAAELLGKLYGGRDLREGDGKIRRVVRASTGQATATLRRGWQLESILREADTSSNGESKGKPRSDHRHHAIDAIVIALTSERSVQLLSRAASLAHSWEEGARAFRSIPSPWADFVDSIRPHIETMLVSHRPEHKMSGALHDGTNYGKARRHDRGRPVIHQRRLVTGLKPNDIACIPDPAVQDAVRRHAEALNGDLKSCEVKNNWPCLTSRTGKQIPIRRVRLAEVKNTQEVGAGVRTRYIEPGDIHHAALYVMRDRRGREKWDRDIVSLLEASERHRRKQEIVRRNHPKDPDAQFLFSLMKNDTVQLEKDGQQTLYLITSFESDGRISMVPISAAGKRDEQKATGKVLRASLGSLRAWSARKVSIDLLGRLHSANG